MDRLNKLGDWMAVNGEAIYDTIPAGKVRILGGPAVRTVQKGSALTLLLPPAIASTIARKIENGWQPTR